MIFLYFCIHHGKTQGNIEIMKNFNSMMERSNVLRIVATVDCVTQYRP